MENKLRKLFDFQKFQNNEKLAGVISEAEGSEKRKLSADELDGVSAAGDFNPLAKQLEGTETTSTAGILKTQKGVH